MFSSLKSIAYRRSFMMFFRNCTKCNIDVLRRHGIMSSMASVMKNNRIRYLSHRPVTVVNSDGSDSERENPSDADEETGTRKRPAQLNHIYEVIKKSKFLTEEEVMKFRDNVLRIGSIVNDSNLDAVIIGMCASLRNMDFADSYLSFLKQRNMEINVATMGRYMRLCYACGKVEDESKVLNIYRCLREKLPVMDASTSENIIHGLCVTSKWKEGLDLLTMVKETCAPSASAYSALIVAAFRNRDAETGWNLMEECISLEKTPLDVVYMTWLSEYCSRGQDSNINQCIERGERLLNFFACHEILISKEVSQKVKHTFENLNWQCKYGPINERGVCQICRGEMRPIFVSRSEFQVLSQTFLEKVLVGPDIFSKSSPDEFKSFQELIAKEAPFNTVIDGLNVAYSAGGRGPRNNPASILQSVVAHFVDLSHKILVLGRTHMNAWPRKEMEYIRKNSQLFLAENISQDDPFLLYAAMSSGPGTCFISRDLMRSHAYRLKCAEPSLAGVFRRWQMSHQMRLLGVLKNNRVNIKLPLEFSPTVQKVDGKWHIPYQEDEGVVWFDQGDGKQVVPRSFLDAPTSWLCISPKKAGQKSFKKNFYGEWSRNHDHG